MDHSLSTRPTVRGERGITYPESDGKPMGETGVHVEVMLAVLAMLRRHYSGNDRVAVLANMFIYYQEGDPKRVVCPDVFVTLDVPSNTRRRTFKVWEEGKGPDLVIEITSKQTRKEDLHKKFDLYREVLGVREYFLFDPLEEYLEPSLQGYRLIDGRYGSIASAGAGLCSEVLGLRLERDEMDLRFFNPETGRRIPSAEEIDQAAEAAELSQSRPRPRTNDSAVRSRFCDAVWRRAGSEGGHLRLSGGSKPIHGHGPVLLDYNKYRQRISDRNRPRSFLHERSCFDQGCTKAQPRRRRWHSISLLGRQTHGRDGNPRAVALVYIYGVLCDYFLSNPTIAVHADMFVYYVKGDPKQNVCPDAFVATGVSNEPNRRSYKVWIEGKAP